MLTDMSWLASRKVFPPVDEKPRLERYIQNQLLFDGDHFATRYDAGAHRHINSTYSPAVAIYDECAKRIKRVIGNFDDVISFPVLFNYQRLLTLKMADLICGEPPTISGQTLVENETLKDIQEYTDFNSKIYEAVIDISRYGDSIHRVYKDADGRYTFVNWDPTEWFPVISQDGTRTILYHCLCWRVNTSQTGDTVQNWQLHVQIHGTQPDAIGYYDYRTYSMDSTGEHIYNQLSSARISTGLKTCAVQHLRSFATTSTPFGYDDYMQIDSILSEIMTRVGQISVILDKHADPNLTGPVSMLKQDPHTGAYSLETGKFFATSPGESPPQYLTWNGQLDAAFKQLDLLINQLYILSELGSALIGDSDKGMGVASGTAMRFKMVNPLAKTRRVSQNISNKVRNLFSALSEGVIVEKPVNLTDDAEHPFVSTGALIPVTHISITWYDGVPDDPRESIEMARLATGNSKIMPIERAIMEYFGRTNAEAKEWMQQSVDEAEFFKASGENGEPPSSAPGVRVTSRGAGSETGLQSFHSPQNGEAGDMADKGG